MYIYIHYGICSCLWEILIQVLRRGVGTFKIYDVFKKLYFCPLTLFVLVPLQVLGELEAVVHEVPKAILTDLLNVKLLANEV